MVFKKLFFAVVLLIAAMTAKAQEVNAEKVAAIPCPHEINTEKVAIIPEPQEMTVLNAGYKLPETCKILCPKNLGKETKKEVIRFADLLQRTTATTVKVNKRGKADITLSLNNSLPKEGYTLVVNLKGIKIAASAPVGFFYAFQTLKQILPTSVMANVSKSVYSPITLPCLQIKDAPRFGWRGFMLDEGRHFFGKKEVERILDIMALYKMNRFHWHLTDDQGWRIQIKKYPKLTEIGAWRNTNVLPWGNVKADGKHYGGYYTQKDIKDIVKYAKQRFIEIVPEIDMPGHFQAAVASYPNILSNNPSRKYTVLEGQGIADDVMNVSSPGALQFTKDVIKELSKLFPYEYLHLGGDECPTTQWKKNPSCQALLKKLNSSNYHDLQTHFYEQILNYIHSLPKKKQRKLIFWNEVLKGNTKKLKGITVMAWVGAERAAKKASEAGFDNILTPQPAYYINRKQSQNADEPHTQGKGKETLQAVYAYQPAKNIPSNLLPHYKGVQANFWTEWVNTPQLLEYLMLPRLTAVAEAGWTPASERNYADFLRRVKAHTAFYKMAGIDYGKAALK